MNFSDLPTVIRNKIITRLKEENFPLKSPNLQNVVYIIRYPQRVTNNRRI